jgi:hypothetical protein
MAVVSKRMLLLGVVGCLGGPWQKREYPIVGSGLGGRGAMHGTKTG